MNNTMHMDINLIMEKEKQVILKGLIIRYLLEQINVKNA